MISIPELKYLNSLRLKKKREEYRQFIAEGPRTVEYMLAGRLQVVRIYALAGWIENNSSTGLASPEMITEVGPKELERISGVASPNQVVALVDMPADEIQPGDPENSLVPVLDDISDPGNMGTIIRLADWFGIDNILCSPDCVDCFNPKVVQSSMGSIARVKVHYTDLDKVLANASNNIAIYGSFMSGENIYTAKLGKQGYVIIGNEARGISDKVARHIKRKLTIPFFGQETSRGGRPDSLNASVAAAVVLSEFSRRL